MSNSRWTHLVGAVDVNFRLDDGHEPAADHARRDARTAASRQLRYRPGRSFESRSEPWCRRRSRRRKHRRRECPVKQKHDVKPIAHTEIKINLPTRRRYRAPPRATPDPSFRLPLPLPPHHDSVRSSSGIGFMSCTPSASGCKPLSILRNGTMPLSSHRYVAVGFFPWTSR